MTGLLPYFQLATATFRKVPGDGLNIPMLLLHVCCTNRDITAASAGIFFSLN